MSLTIANFGKTVKSFLLGKVKSKASIILLNSDIIESNETEVAKTLNEFFSNIAQNLEVLEYQCEDNLHSRYNLHSRLSNNSVLQAKIKYRYHPSIDIIRRYSQRFPSHSGH